MLILSKAALASALCAFGLVHSLATQAQAPVVNCGMFRNAQDQASCIAQNQQAARIYQQNRQTEYAYYGAYGLNQAGKFAAGRAVPGGGVAWGAGNMIGTYAYEHQQPPRVYSPPPIPQPQYTPPQLPQQLRPYAPIYPNYGPPRQR